MTPVNSLAVYDAFIVNEPVRFTTQKKGEEVEIR